VTATNKNQRYLVASLDLSGRGALIVGGTRGIGYAVAQRFCRAGAKVCVVGQRESTVTAAVNQLDASGYKIDGLVADVISFSAVVDANERAESLLGGVDILVVAAGIVGPTAPVWEYDESTFRHIIEVNFMGTVHWLRATLPAMRCRKRRCRRNVRVCRRQGRKSRAISLLRGKGGGDDPNQVCCQGGSG